MFVILLNYIKPLSEVEKHVVAHRTYLDRYYANGTLVASGPQVPRTGGLIIANAASRSAVGSMIAEDPFFKEHIAEYQVIEFQAVKTAPQLREFLSS